MLGGGRAVTLVLQAAQLALVARLLNPTEFGTWAAATALVLVASALADCGLGPTAVIYLTSGEGTLDDVVAANTVAMICAVILVCAASLGFGSAVAIATLSLTPWLVITRLQAPSVAALQQRLHLKRIVVGDLVGTSLQTALLAGLLAVFTAVVLHRALAIQAAGAIPFCAVRFDCGCGGGAEFICAKLRENAAMFLLAAWLLAGRGRALCVRYNWTARGAAQARDAKP